MPIRWGAVQPPPEPTTPSTSQQPPRPTIGELDPGLLRSGSHVHVSGAAAGDVRAVVDFLVRWHHLEGYVAVRVDDVPALPLALAELERLLDEGRSVALFAVHNPEDWTPELTRGLVDLSGRGRFRLVVSGTHISDAALGALLDERLLVSGRADPRFHTVTERAPRLYGIHIPPVGPAYEFAVPLAGSGGPGGPAGD